MTLDRSIGPRCNIGPAEIARRRQFASAALLATAIVAAALVATHVPVVARLAIWPFTAGTAVAWLQVVNSFCVHFGTLGIQNFGALGRALPVDPAMRAADRRRALLMIAEGALIGVVVTLALMALPA